MPRPSHNQLRSLSQFITTHNPFYLISAVFVLYGLTQISTVSGSVTAGWLLMALLCGYTVLTAVTGWAIVRFGQVWEDARAILLIILLLVLALSNSFDQVALKDFRVGAAFLTGGLAFAVALSESLLRSLRIWLSPLIRAPLYCSLALLFIYPIWLSSLSIDGHNEAMIWGVYLFPWLAALVLLTLLPAAHRGPDEMPNGTPWTWPWYPWSLIAVLIIGLALRSYSLSMAFEPTRGTGISWRPYFLVPLVIVALTLLLELSLVVKNRLIQSIAMAAPLGLLLLSLPGYGGTTVDGRFLAMLRATAGSPLQITTAALLAFYAVAWLRGRRFGQAGILVCLILFAFIDSNTVNIATFAKPSMITLDALAVGLILVGLYGSSSWWMLAGILTGVSSLTIRGQDTWFTAANGFYPLHLAILLTLVVAIALDDATARAIRRFAWRVIPVAALLAGLLYDSMFPGIPVIVQIGYVATLGFASAILWYLAKGFGQLIAALATVLANGVAHLRQLYLFLATSDLGRALPFLALGLAFLLVAAAVSLWKGGVVRRVWLGAGKAG